MTDATGTGRTCARGHAMDPAWEVCPYCPPDRRASTPLAATVRMEDAEQAAAVEAARLERRTEILRAEPEIDGVAWLVGLTDGHRGETHRVDAERVTIGAGAECEVVIDDDHVSDRQASLRFADGVFHLTDLDSTNGTLVNGESVQKTTLGDGDTVQLGRSEWVFKCVVFES